MLGEFDDPEARCTRHAFVAAPIGEDQVADIGIVRVDLFTAPGHNDLDHSVRNTPLQEDVLHRAVATHALAVDHRLVRADFSESSRFNTGEVSRTPGFRADAVDGLQGARGEIDGQPRHEARERHEQPHQRSIYAARTYPASHHRGHLTIAVEPAETHHDRQEQANGDDDRQVLGG